MTEPATPQSKEPATPTPFERFEQLTKSILRVTKKDLDAKLAEEKRQRKAARDRRA